MRVRVAATRRRPIADPAVINDIRDDSREGGERRLLEEQHFCEAARDTAATTAAAAEEQGGTEEQHPLLVEHVFCSIMPPPTRIWMVHLLFLIVSATLV